jgi:hypothetical protein
LVIAHPECTYIANSGVRWLRERPDRWGKMVDASLFFRWVLDLPNQYPNIKGLMAENPIPHKYALSIIGCNYTQIIQPWQFGHGEVKATCLWLYNLPKLVPTDVVDGREARVHRMAPGPDRQRERSRTYHGIAEAMAEQWGRTSVPTI